MKRALAGKAIRRKNTAVVAEVTIPTEFASLVESHPGEARKLQSAARRELQTCFARKLAITGFVIDGSAGRYILERLGRTRARTGAE